MEKKKKEILEIIQGLNNTQIIDFIYRIVHSLQKKGSI